MEFENAFDFLEEESADPNATLLGSECDFILWKGNCNSALYVAEPKVTGSNLVKPNKKGVLCTYAVIFVLGFIINALLFSIILTSGNRYIDRSRWIVCVRVVCDFTKIFFALPIYTYIAIRADWQLSSHLCHVVAFFITFLESFSVLIWLVFLSFLTSGLDFRRSIRRGSSATQTQQDQKIRRNIILRTIASVLLATLMALPPGVFNRQVVLHSSTLSPDGLQLANVSLRFCSNEWPNVMFSSIYYAAVCVVMYLLPLLLTARLSCIIIFYMRTQPLLHIPRGMRLKRHKFLFSFLAMSCVMSVSWPFACLLKFLTTVLELKHSIANEFATQIIIFFSLIQTITNPIFVIFLSKSHQKMVTKAIQSFRSTCKKCRR